MFTKAIVAALALASIGAANPVEKRNPCSSNANGYTTPAYCPLAITQIGLIDAVLCSVNANIVASVAACCLAPINVNILANGNVNKCQVQ